MYVRKNKMATNDKEHVKGLTILTIQVAFLLPPLQLWDRVLAYNNTYFTQNIKISTLNLIALMSFQFGPSSTK